MPDVARATPPFNVESLAGAEDQIESRLTRRKVEFESIEFNRRFIATVPKEHDPTALRETFSPGFLDWAAQIEADVDFGVSERQLYFLWRLRARTLEESRRPWTARAACFAGFALRWRSTACTPTRRARGTRAWSRFLRRPAA